MEDNIHTISEFEHALKDVLQIENQLLPGTTQIVVQFEGEFYRIKTIFLEKGIIIITVDE